ncbi:hypothetical protein [Candidatus Agathobaculum pullicola]|uniref:hypothetical protein n=1 Tax=Candidatus Agathobaculum pullicola TaxID=2838426 RepID=UPI003F8E61FF
MVVFPKCTNTSCAEFDPLILKLNIRTVVIIKELAAGNLKTPHVKIPRSQSDTGKRRSFFRLLIGRMDTGGSLKVIRRFEPGPARVDGYKAFEQAAVNHPQLREDRAMSILGVVQKVLNGNEIISGNNALVVIPVICSLYERQ